MLQDALEYLAWGDTRNARAFMDMYDEWKATGEAPWPYDPSKPTPREQLAAYEDKLEAELVEDEGGGVWQKDELDDPQFFSISL